MPLHVSSHPVVLDCLAGLRDRRTEPEEFRALARKIMTLLLYEATTELPARAATVTTPMHEAEASYLDAEVVAIPVLRAGLGLLPPVIDLLPRVSVGYLGLERDERTAVARIYYRKLPPMAGKVPLLLDPMLATGGSATQALDLITEAGGAGTRLVCVVAAPEGVRRVEAAHPDVLIFTAALDEGLDPNAFILPGLGDFGDRLFGTTGS
jgi:uracil phosphoribosyltransferase